MERERRRAEEERVRADTERERAEELRRGGLSTLPRYGTSWYTMLALYRWGKVSSADLEAARPVRG